LNRDAERDRTGDRHAACVADAQPPIDDAEIFGSQGGSAAQNHFRRSALSAPNHHVLERNASAETRSESLQHRFLGSESAGKPFDPIGTFADFRELVGGKATRDQRITRIFDPSPQRGDLDEINSVSDHTHLSSPFGSLHSLEPGERSKISGLSRRLIGSSPSSHKVG
jgi:hypothetical protein